MVAMSCVVVGYTSRCVDSSLSFHRIPKEEKLLNMCVYVVDYTPVVMRSNTRYSRDVVVSSDTRICK